MSRLRVKIKDGLPYAKTGDSLYVGFPAEIKLKKIKKTKEGCELLFFVYTIATKKLAALNVDPRDANPYYPYDGPQFKGKNHERNIKETQEGAA